MGQSGSSSKNTLLAVLGQSGPVVAHLHLHSELRITPNCPDHVLKRLQSMLTDSVWKFPSDASANELIKISLGKAYRHYADPITLQIVIHAFNMEGYNFSSYSTSGESTTSYLIFSLPPPLMATVEGTH